MVPRIIMMLLCAILNIQKAFTTDLVAREVINNPEDSAKSVTALRKWYVPHFIPIQYAGNIGFISSGIGYASGSDNYQFSMLYGYAPKSITGVSIHTITARNTIHIYRLHLSRQKTLIPYAALGVSIELGGRSFLTPPSVMPKGYYDAPKSTHIVFSGGLKFRHETQGKKHFRGTDFFLEATTIDAYAWYKFISDEIKLSQIVSLSFGVNLLLK
jgi:hypothetical protein